MYERVCLNYCERYKFLKLVISSLQKIYATELKNNKGADQMWVLILGLVLFIGIHLTTALPRKRHKLVRQLGESKYKIGFSLIAFVGLVLIIIGYASARPTATVLYEPPFELRHLAMLLVLIAFLLFPAARLSGHIRYWVRHPQITAVKLWAFAHLLVNGDLASILLFGSFLAWGVFDRISLKKREQFGLVKTRNFQPKITHDALAIVIGVALYAAFAFYLHGLLFGQPLL